MCSNSLRPDGLPSLFEGLPNALAEGLANWFACRSGVSGVEELIIDGTTGLLVDQKEKAVGLVRALSRLMSDAHYRAKLREAARQHGPDRLFALWEDILTEAAGPGLAQGAETVAAGLLLKGVEATL